MRVRVFFTPAEVEPADVQDRTLIVIDVLRATSSIVAALAAGARAIYPVADLEEALRLASTLGREDTLLCGERRSVRIEGFQLGNSPAEFTPAAVGGKQLVMTTTNGTRAFHAASGARVLVAAFLNLDAVARSAAAAGELVVICAGREGRFGLEDAVCAGMLLERIEQVGASPELDDAGRAARLLAGGVTLDETFLAGVAAGRALVKAGLADDLEYCARLDTHPIVPRMQNRMIRLDHGS